MEKTESNRKWIETFVDRLTVLSAYASGWTIFIMMVLVSVAVIARRLFGYPLVFSDEYSAYLMVFCVFLGGAYTLQQDAHIRVDIIAIRLKPKTKMVLQAVTSLFSLTYGIVLTWQTAKLVIYYKEVGQRALSIMETPTWVPAIAIPVGLAILTLQMALCLANEIRFLLRKDDVEKSNAV
jgi:TRAP-type C4-dicarboxylate transport system permease small subunit